MYDESAGAIAVHPLRDSSFVGRAEEYALLTEVAAAAETGQPQVVLVGGEAGVGKSRLVEYVASILQGRGWRVLVGSCTARGSQALPLAPFIAALRRLIRDLGIEDAARTFPEGFGFELLLPEWSGKRLEPEVLTSTPLFHGFMILFEQLSADAPLLFVLEDVHDADPETLKLVGALARSLDNVPVLIVATYRTDDVFRGHPLRPLLSEWQRIRNIRHLVLDRFSRTETAELIENTSGKRPSDALLTRIFGRSGGNAFFVEQLARTELAGVAGGLPDTLRDLLLNRLEQLPQPVREVVQLIAVGGPVVAHRLLASVADMPEDALLAALRVAVDAHVLITSEDGYGFQHALVREAAVDALLPGERIRMHHAYADALDRQPNLVAAERHAAGTAYHWLGAGRPDRALPLLVRAAAVAEGFRAYAEQHQLLTCALEAWPNALDPGIARLDLLVAAAQAACRAVAHDHAHHLIDQALDEADPAGDADQVAALLALRSRILLRQGGKGALAAAQEAARLALPERSPARAAVFEVLATALTSDGVPDNALTASADAVRLATDLGDEELQVKALSTAALVFSHLGRHEQGVAAYERARAIAEKIRDMEGLTRVCVNFSLELWAYGRHEEAIAVAAAGVQAARRAGLTNAQGMYAATNLAGSLFATGRWDEAEHVLTEALEEGPCDVYLGYPHMMLAELALGRGDLTGARRHHAVASQLLFSQLERLECGLPMARLTAELALMENRFADARLAITAVLDAATVRGQTAAYAWPLLATAARIEVQATAHGLPSGSLTMLHKTAAGLPQHPPSWRAWALQFAAEMDSIQAPSPVWAAVATAWEKTDELYPTCHARLRAAEAAIVDEDYEQARQWLVAAAEDAAQLGANPLSQEVELLATSARLSLLEAPKSALHTTATTRRLGLTQRETEVLFLLAEGLPNKAIAERLVITEKTVSVHVSRILAKLNANNRTHAVITARRQGLLEHVRRSSATDREARSELR